MSFHNHVLANGLRIVGEISPTARSAALGFFVRTGARDETADVSGVTHFLEHMVFKGTPRRTALDVNRDFDHIGAQYNAFTSHENTVFYAAILPEYVPQAVDILTDILRPSLRQEDFDMEKQVIIEEIARYEDMPHWDAFDRAMRLYFAGHPLANSILGTPASITALGRDQMEEYFRRRYVANNITLAVGGNIDWPSFTRLIEQKCGGWESGPAPREDVRAASGTGKASSITKEKVAQQYVIVMSPAPPADSPLRFAATTLAVILGDDSGSRLYWALVDPGLADSADASFHEYDGTGSFCTSFSCEPESAADNLKLARKVLGEVQARGVTELELKQAQNKILSRVVRHNERPMERMQALGMNWTYLGQYRSVDEDLRSYESVTVQSIRNLLDQFSLEKVTTFGLGPTAAI
jgi:predicted Zn-dependent peptidase